MSIKSTVRYSGLVALFAWMIISTFANAATRVLVRFDETGHYTHRVHRSTSTETQLALASTDQSATNSEVLLRWLDSNGVLLATTRMIDPRVTHAPLQAGSTDFAWTVLGEGAYLVSGPDSAVQLEIILPARSTPNVPAETWLLDLI